MWIKFIITINIKIKKKTIKNEVRKKFQRCSVSMKGNSHHKSATFNYETRRCALIRIQNLI